eukprot:m.269302 g.269302  ORF g.269302 m.269302 type:complete len:102 (+) comp40534_c1_seq50:121-426(+)
MYSYLLMGLTDRDYTFHNVFDFPSRAFPVKIFSVHPGYRFEEHRKDSPVAMLLKNFLPSFEVRQRPFIVETMSRFQLYIFDGESRGGSFAEKGKRAFYPLT